MTRTARGGSGDRRSVAFAPPPTQAERNDAEWHRDENWRGWLDSYVAPNDTRVWVPKRSPWMGWTLNFAHRVSWLWLAALLGLPLLGVAVGIVLGP